MKPMEASLATMQAVFDALDAFAKDTGAAMATGTISYDGGGVNHSMTAQDRSGENRYQYSERVAGVRVAISPASATVSAGGSVQFTAAVTDPDGKPTGAAVTWSIPAGSPGTISAAGLYTAPGTVEEQAAVQVSAAAAEAQAWAVATVLLVP
jgi:hypothetical protein